MRGLRVCGALTLLGVGASTAVGCGSGDVKPGSRDEIAAPAAIDKVRKDNPGVRIAQSDGRITRMYGASLSRGATPRESADAFVDRYASAFGAARDELRSIDAAGSAGTSPSKTGGPALANQPGMQGLMFDRATGRYRFYLARYAQLRQDIPVSNAELKLLVANEPDAPVVLAASTVKDLGAFRPVVRGRNIDLAKANAAVKQVSSRTDFKGAPLAAIDPALSNVESSELVIWAGPTGTAQNPRVAVSFVADNYGNTAGPRPEKWHFYADAETGDILHQESLIVFADVPGHVSGMVTTSAREMRCDPKVEMPFPFADVKILGGASAQANADGDFLIPNPGTSPVTVQSPVGGFHFNVFDFQPSRNEVLAVSVTPPSPANFVHNAAASSEFLTGQANGYYHATRVRDWVLAHHPTYPDVFAQQNFPVRVNEPDSAQSLCAGNAWYDGAALNFCAAFNAPGPAQDYGNTAFASVSQHEYGHHLVEVAGSGQGEYGEGMGDVISALVNDDPRLGLGFYASGCGASDPTCCNKALRSADNNCQYSAGSCSVCGTAGCGHCGSEIHACGELLSGAVWDLRQELDATDPENALDIVSDLALNSILLHTGTSINNQIVVDFLTLDDDDGNLENGTPHATEICAAFGAHGLNCPAEGTGLTVSPTTAFKPEGPAGGPFTAPSAIYTVENLGAGSIQYAVSTAAPWLTIGGGAGTLASLGTAPVTVQLNGAANLLTNGVYSTAVVFTNLTAAVDVTRNVTLTVGRTTAVSWNLDSNPGWTMSGQWAWGTPVGGGGTIGGENFGSPDPTGGFTGTKVLGYNLSGNYPASLAAQNLTTGAIDCSNLSHVSVRFRRWLCVEESAYDHAAVSVSTNLTTWTPVWTNAQTLNGGYWTQQDLDISAAADHQPTVYVRWTMGATDAAWQYCGWNLDDIEIRGIPEPDCTTDGECSDGLYCNGVETCAGGECHAGTAPSCADAVSCTTDSCDEATDTCLHAPVNAVCGDGLFCNGTETCNAVLGCQAGTAPNCADAVSCTTDTCDEASDTCLHAPVDGLCGDGLFCNGTETCNAVLGCQAGTAPNCADAVSCTTDTCDEAGDTCLHAPVDGLCSDGLFCNGTETCNAVLGCQAGTAPNCADAVSCTTDTCDEAGDTCLHAPVDGLCGDGLFCNGTETCNAVLGCQAGTAPNCADAVTCTTDTCDEASDTCLHAPVDGPCGDGLFCNGTETCNAVLGCQAGVAPCGGGSCNEATDTCSVPVTAKLEAATVMVGGTAVTVSLENTYVNPVVVTSMQYANNTQAVVTRVRNVTGSGFEIYLQRPYGGAVVADKVSYLVVEEGVWNIDGEKIEAHQYLSTVTDTSTSPVGNLQVYGQPYVNPVVMGQVMTTNDARWSTFWCAGGAVTDPPSASALRTGKRVDDDTISTRANETVGYVVMEAGHGTIGGVAFDANVGPDTVMGVADAPPYAYSYTAPFASAPQVAVVTMAGRDGYEGGWGITYGSAPMTTTTMNLATDDVGKSGRTHLTEQVGYAVFEVPTLYPPACASDAACNDGLFCNGVETCDPFAGCQAGVAPCGGGSCNETTDTCGTTAKLEAATVMVGGTAVTVSLENTYVNPVVVTSMQYANNTQAVVTRVRNVTGSGFEIYLQRPYGGAVVADKVSYLVVEEGVWNIDGEKIEAHQYLSTVTDTSTSPVGNLQVYGQPYVNPVVMGQVMTTNDARWSTFWCAGGAVTDPPSASALRTGKRVDDDTISTRANETVGYVVMEAGHGTIGGVAFDANVGPDTVMGVADAPPYAYSYTAPFASAPQVAVVTMAGRDGYEGGWGITYGAAPMTTTTMNLATDDVGKSGRTHLTEQVGYAVFEVPTVYPPASATAKLEAATVMVGGTAVTVSLENTYVNPVVVTSMQYANNTQAVVTRVRNVTGSGFEIYLQRPYGGAVVADKVSYLVVEEGVWNIDGEKIEAHQYLSTVTDTSTSPVGNLQVYGQPYVNPVVMGQVMTTNDARWSTFWCAGGAVTDPPSASALRTGKRVDDDTISTRANETVGYVVMEAGHGTIGGVAFDANVGPDTVMGVADAPPYAYSYTAPFASAPQVAVVTMAGRDGYEGGWGITYGAAPMTTTTMNLATDDVGKSGRTHLTEQVGYAVFEVPTVYASP